MRPVYQPRGKAGSNTENNAVDDKDDSALPFYVKVVSSKPVIVRAEADKETPLSSRLGVYAPGSWLLVLELATTADGTVRARTADGWITQTKEPSKTVVLSLRKPTATELQGEDVTSRSMIVCARKPLLVRLQSELSSSVAGTLAPGTSVEVLEVHQMADGTTRARTPSGWVTQAKELTNPKQENLLKLTDEEAAEAEATAFVPDRLQQVSPLYLASLGGERTTSAASLRSTGTSRSRSTPKKRPSRNAQLEIFEEQWDTSSYYYVPHQLKGTKPMTYERWNVDAKAYWLLNIKSKQQERMADKYALFTKYDTFTKSGGYKSGG